MTRREMHRREMHRRRTHFKPTSPEPVYQGATITEIESDDELLTAPRKQPQSRPMPEEPDVPTPIIITDTSQSEASTSHNSNTRPFATTPNSFSSSSTDGTGSSHHQYYHYSNNNNRPSSFFNPRATPMSFSEPQPRKRSHFGYKLEHERYLAQLFSESNAWEILNGSVDRNLCYASKAAVLKSIAKRFNDRFSTEGRPVSITESQVKSKLRSMETCWRRGLHLFRGIEKGLVSLGLNQSKEQKVMATCHFFFIVNDLWSSPKNPRVGTPILTMGADGSSKYSINGEVIVRFGPSGERVEEEEGKGKEKKRMEDEKGEERKGGKSAHWNPWTGRPVVIMEADGSSTYYVDGETVASFDPQGRRVGKEDAKEDKGKEKKGMEEEEEKDQERKEGKEEEEERGKESEEEEHQMEEEEHQMEEEEREKENKDEEQRREEEEEVEEEEGHADVCDEVGPDDRQEASAGNSSSTLNELTVAVGSASDDIREASPGDRSSTKNERIQSGGPSDLEDNPIIQENQPSSSASTNQKRRFEIPDHGSTVPENLGEQLREERNLKRRKLELEETTQAELQAFIRMQRELLRLQIVRLKREMADEDTRRQLDLENESYSRETEKLKLEVERKKILWEQSQLDKIVDQRQGGQGQGRNSSQPQRGGCSSHHASPTRHFNA